MSDIGYVALLVVGLGLAATGLELLVEKLLKRR